MRELKVVGLDVDGMHILCEDDQPLGTNCASMTVCAQPCAVTRSGSTRHRWNSKSPRRCCDPKRFRPASARAHRWSSSPRRGVDMSRIMRFAHPVLLERARAAELATASHPVLEDGPSVLTLLETVTTALVARGLDPDATLWDAWRNEDGRWTVQLAWKAGRSDNLAHFRFTPGAHGGTVDRVRRRRRRADRPALRAPPLRWWPRRTARLRHPATTTSRRRADDEPEPAEPEPEPSKPAPPSAARPQAASPAVPAWEDVLLGVRSSGEPLTRAYRRRQPPIPGRAAPASPRQPRRRRQTRTSAPPVLCAIPTPSAPGRRRPRG